jgi:hypothetical protein
LMVGRIRIETLPGCSAGARSQCPGRHANARPERLGVVYAWRAGTDPAEIAAILLGKPWNRCYLALLVEPPGSGLRTAA